MKLMVSCGWYWMCTVSWAHINTHTHITHTLHGTRIDRYELVVPCDMVAFGVICYFNRQNYYFRFTLIKYYVNRDSRSANLSWDAVSSSSSFCSFPISFVNRFVITLFVPSAQQPLAQTSQTVKGEFTKRKKNELNRFKCVTMLTRYTCVLIAVSSYIVDNIELILCRYGAAYSISNGFPLYSPFHRFACFT